MSELLTHHTKMINGFRMHYVTAGSGYPLVFCPRLAAELV